MSDDPLESFVHQIASWAEQAIEQGRSPFRKVETGLQLLTPHGVQTAPLVFWINRDSFMAGGLLLFPDQGAPPPLEQGGRLAEALGLKHFVEWTDHQIRFWDISDQQQPQLSEKFELSATSPDPVSAFKSLLDRTLDKLKYLSVMGSFPPENLSSSYLANLCHSAIDDTLPLLEAEQRIFQGEGGKAIDNWPRAKAYQTVNRLITLTSLDLLPTAVQPEGLEKAIRFSLPDLPEPLKSLLRFTELSIALPNAAAVRFHHLLRRLQQLGLKNTFERSCECLLLLLRHDGMQLTAATSPPEADKPVEFLLNDTTAPRLQPSHTEIASPPILASRGLIRHLQNWRQPELQRSQLFSLHLTTLPKTIQGLLFNQTRPSRGHRQQIDAALRISWPARRFKLSTTAPIWLFECLHLLGRCQAGGTLLLKVPANWLEASWGDPLWELISQEFTLQQLTLEDNDWTTLQMTQGEQFDTEVQLNGQATETISWQTLSAQPREHVSACLSLPHAWLRMLKTGQLTTWQDAALIGRTPQALRFFFAHPPGDSLAGLFDVPLTELDDQELAEAVITRGIPIPADERLERLEDMLSDGSTTPKAGAEDIAECFSWLGIEYQQLPPVIKCMDSPRRSEQKRHRVPQGLANQVTDEVFCDGVPVFPEHYLYDHYRPELEHFNWQGELRFGPAFFGHIILRDSSGVEFEISGEARASGLWLAALSTREAVDYPCAADICESILVRYLADLQRLRQALIKKAHEYLPQPRQAESLIKKLWESQNLPEWDKVEKVAALFPGQFGVE